MLSGNLSFGRCLQFQRLGGVHVAAEAEAEAAATEAGSNNSLRFGLCLSMKFERRARTRCLHFNAPQSVSVSESPSWSRMRPPQYFGTGVTALMLQAAKRQTQNGKRQAAGGCCCGQLTSFGSCFIYTKIIQHKSF